MRPCPALLSPIRGLPRGGRAGLQVALALATLWALPAAAQPAPTAIDVTLVGELPRPALEAALREGLGARDLAVTVRADAALNLGQLLDAGSATNGRLRAWVVREPEPDQVTLLFSLGPGDPIATQSVPLPSGLDAVAEEEIGQLLVSSLIALIETPPLRSAAVEASPTEPEPTEAARPVEPATEDAPVAETPPPPTWRSMVLLGYEGAIWDGAEPLLHGPRVGLAFALDDFLLRVEAGWQFRVRFVFPDGQDGYEVEGPMVSGNLGWTALRGEPVSVLALLGVSIDVQRATPFRAGVSGDDETWRAVMLLRPAVALSIGDRSDIGVRLELGADVSPAHDGFRVRRGAQVAEPWPVRPRIAMRVAFDLAQPGAGR